MHDIPLFITAFGDRLVLLPSSILLLVYLLLLDSRNAAVSWGLTLGLCLTCVVAAKILGYLLVPTATIPMAAVRTSGHAAFAALYYTSVAIVAGRMRSDGAALLLYVASAGLSGAVAVSRQFLTAHTVLEITLGTILGLAFSGLFARQLGDRADPSARIALPLSLWGGIMAVLCLTDPVLCGVSVNTEEAFQLFARVLGASFR